MAHELEIKTNLRDGHQKTPSSITDTIESHGPRVHPVLRLQQTIGNQAVQRLIQAKAASSHHGNESPTQLQCYVGQTQNHTGMSDPLKEGLEALSGIDLSGVRVHHNSSKPAQLNVLAFTQGQDIHVGPGQDKHLPHEGWHVVQQMQGRVKSTIQANGLSINDDAGLEREADVMGAKALQLKGAEQATKGSTLPEATSLQQGVETKGESGVPAEAIGEFGEKVRLNFLYLKPPANSLWHHIATQDDTVQPKKREKRTIANFEPTAWDYIQSESFPGLLLADLADLPLQLSLPYVKWQYSGSYFARHVLAFLHRERGREKLYVTIAKVIVPQNIDSLVERTRSFVSGTRRERASQAAYSQQVLEQLLPGKTDVSLAIASALHYQVQSSLHRLVRPYVSARVYRYDQEDNPYAAALPQAMTGDLPMFHPMDEFVAKALCHRNELIKVNETRIPAGDKLPGKPHRVRKVNYSVLADAPGWVKAVPSDGSPEPATAEEVAAALLGDRKKAYQLLVSPPLFAIRRELTNAYVSDLGELTALRGLTASMRPVVGLIPGADDVLDRLVQPTTPEASLLTSEHADELALSQAGTSGARAGKVSRDTAIKMLTRCKIQMLSMSRLAGRFRLQNMVAPALDRINQRLEQMASADPADIAKWTHHAAVQSKILFEAISGLGRAASHLGPAAPGAAVQSGEASAALPFPVRESIFTFATAYARAGAYSEFAGVARGHLEEARVLEKKSVVDAVDQMLTDNLGLYESVKGMDKKFLPRVTGHAPGTEAGFRPHIITSQHQVSVIELRDEHLELREQAARLRARLLAGDPGAADDTAQLAIVAGRFKTNSSFIQLLAKLNQVRPFLDELSTKWQGGFTGDDVDLYDMSTDLLPLQKEIDALYRKWYSSFTMSKSSSVADARQQALDRMNSAEEAFVKYIKKQQIKRKLEKATDLIEDAQFRMMIVDIATMVGATLISMGAGALASGFAAGLRLGATAQFVAATATETIVQGVIDAKLFGSDDVAGSMATDAAFNFAQFGGMRAFQGALRLRRARKWVSGVTEEGIETGTRLGRFAGKVGEASGQGLIIFGTQYAQAQYDNARKTGRFMTVDELLQAGLQGLGMMVAGMILNRPIDKLHGHTQVKASAWRLRRIANRRAMRAQKNPSPQATREMIRADREALEAELLHYQRLSKDPKALKAARVDEEQLGKIQGRLDEALYDTRLAELTTTLEPISNTEFLCDTATISRTRSEYDALDIKVSEIEFDPGTGTPYFHATGNDGSRMRIMGRNPIRSDALLGGHHLTMAYRNGKPFVEVCSTNCFDLEAGLHRLAVADDTISNPVIRERVEGLYAATHALAEQLRLGASEKNVKSRLKEIARAVQAMGEAYPEFRSALFDAAPIPATDLPTRLPRPELAELGGAEQASKLGWEPAKRGFHWFKSKDGYPTYRRNKTNPGPRMVYNPTSREFVPIPDPHQGPGVNFRPLTGYDIETVNPYNLPKVLKKGVVYMVPSFESLKKGRKPEYIARAYRDPDGNAVIEWRLQPGPGRRGYEGELNTAKQHYTDAAGVLHSAKQGRIDLLRPTGSSGSTERSHLAGQGTGFEGPWGIGHAPKEVNQGLQGQGIEGFLRAIHDRRRLSYPNGIEFIVSSKAKFDRGTMRWESIEYRIDAEINGQQPVLQALSFKFVDLWTGNPAILDFESSATVGHPNLYRFLLETADDTLAARRGRSKGVRSKSAHRPQWRTTTPVR